MVGDGYELENLKALVKNEAIERQVIFAGKVRYDQVPHYINAGTLCLAPFDTQRNDLTGLSPLKIFEYMALEKPVIASDLQLIKDVIHDGTDGILVPPGTPKKLANAILSLFQNEDLRKQLGRNARSKILQLYSWDKLASLFRDAFKSILRLKEIE